MKQDFVIFHCRALHFILEFFTKRWLCTTIRFPNKSEIHWWIWPYDYFLGVHPIIRRSGHFNYGSKEGLSLRFVYLLMPVLYIVLAWLKISISVITGGFKIAIIFQSPLLRRWRGYVPEEGGFRTRRMDNMECRWYWLARRTTPPSHWHKRDLHVDTLERAGMGVKERDRCFTVHTICPRIVTHFIK